MQFQVLRSKDWQPFEKPTLLFLHGFPDNLHSFVAQMRFFDALDYNVVAAPLRGHEPLYIPEGGDMSLYTQAKDIVHIV